MTVPIESRVPSVLVDSSTYQWNNNGDLAMARTLFNRLRERYPGITIRVVTRDLAGHARYFPDTSPLIVGDRVYWSVFGDVLRLSELDRADVPEFSRLPDLERAMHERFAPVLARELEARDHSQTFRTREEWASAIGGADAVFLMGGGYFSDSFSPHARFLVESLRLATSLGKPTFICGCGFEPVWDTLLQGESRRVLPRVSLIGCREAELSPHVLDGYGVDPARVTVTGDEAFEFAFARRPDELGSAIGVNVRVASYSGVSGESSGDWIEAIRRSLRSTAAEFQAPLLPTPVSNYDPDDLGSLQEILSEESADWGAERLDSADSLAGQVGKCRVVVTGSYHAAVFALSMGIPAVCLAQSSHYRSKMNGLTKLLDAGCVVYLDEPDLEQRLVESIRAQWAAAPVRRAELLCRVSGYIQTSREAFHRMCDLIDANMANPAAPPPMEPSPVSDAEAATALALAAWYNRQIRELREMVSFFEHHATSRLRQLEELREEHAALTERLEALSSPQSVEPTPDGSASVQTGEPGGVDDGEA